MLLIAAIATLAGRQELPAARARQVYGAVLVRATLTVGAMAALHTAGAAYLGVTDPEAGTLPLQVLNTFLPVLLAAVSVLWLPVLALAARPALGEGRRWAWLQVVAPARMVPLWTAGLVAASGFAYAVHLGGWVALQVLYG